MDEQRKAIYTGESHKIKTPFSTTVFNGIGGLILIITALLCLVPFILLISASFTSDRSIAFDGFRLIPGETSYEAYRILFRNPVIIGRAYFVSIFVTLTGTACGLLVTSAAAYPLSRSYFKYRFQLSFYFFFTTLFNGGILATYIFMVRYLNLSNTYAALILPPMVQVFFLLIMRTFMAGIPESIFEAAKIDGANEYMIFFILVLPLSTAPLATIGLFLALGYWNDWYNAMLYVSRPEMYPLQYMLHNMLTAAEAIGRLAQLAEIRAVDTPTRSLRMAMTVIATGPILLVYPFVQRYFIKGITLGSVKG
ncbi:MAG: carbohydrate ABC transporter permease [Oscillospiraceae bacterium]|jgi:putative aldouronate transport system permease protein|nr:carbohydrate ABC transporter permease [Oscillospiraceae bacterium]